MAEFTFSLHQWIDASLLLGQTGEAKGMTLLQQINNGGVTGYIILLLSLVALTLVIMHLITIQPSRMMPPELVSQLRDELAAKRVDEALTLCQDPVNDCFLTRVLANGLTRYRRSAFGPFEFKDALEEAGAEQVARTYRGTDALGLIGSIAPMLGLLGTVIGMVGAFSTISSVGARPELLAADISKALITTLLGLAVAIPTMAVFTFLRNRIDAYAAQGARLIEDLTVPLEPTGSVSDATLRATRSARSQSSSSSRSSSRPASPAAAGTQGSE